MTDLHEYTAYTYNPDIDMEETQYWILCAEDTPPSRPRTPMSDWFFQNCANWGAAYAAEKFPIPTSKNVIFRSHNGYTYMSVIMPKTELATHYRSNKFKESLDFIINNYIHIISTEKQQLLQKAEKIKHYQFDKATYTELSKILDERVDATKQMYGTIFFLNQGLGTIYNLFQDLCENMLGITSSTATFQNLLLGASESFSGIEQELQAMAQKAIDLDLIPELCENKPEDVISKMKKSDKGQTWYQSFSAFLHTHGWRSVATNDYISPLWLEKPSIPISHIQKFAGSKLQSVPNNEITDAIQDRKNLQDALLKKVPIGQKEWFETVMQIARAFAAWKHEHKQYCEILQTAITRHALLQIAHKLEDSGGIQQSEDIFFMVPEEVQKLIYSAGTSNQNLTVSQRRTIWEENKKFIPPPLFSKVAPDQAAYLLLKTKNPIAMDLALGMTTTIATKNELGLSGQVASQGIAEGVARVVLSQEELSEIKGGEILVASTVGPNWSTVFPLIKGVIVEHGGMLSDAAILGREYKIPVITNVNSATDIIKSGQTIRLNANSGNINILQALENKKLLVVDDEEDIIDTIEELLPMCEITRATTFEKAVELLNSKTFDVTILDIMGVNGYKLLEIANNKGFISIMLTAHALTLEDTVKSFREGAAYFVPKEKLSDLSDILHDILENKEKENIFWTHWYDRYAPLYEKRFGHGWQNKHKEFWEIFKKNEY